MGRLFEKGHILLVAGFLAVFAVGIPALEWDAFARFRVRDCVLTEVDC